MLFSSKLGWIGVDLGTHTVKLAQTVRTPEGVSLRHAAVIQRPEPWSESDQLAVEEPDTSWREILAALDCAGFRGRDAACLLPTNACQLRCLKIPQGDERERLAMIASELADDEDRPVAKEFDYWELGGDKGVETAEGFNVNVLSVVRPWIDQVAEDCRRARLDCWAIDGSPLAIARAVGLASEPRAADRAVAIDWGFSSTTLVVVGKSRPLYTRRLPECGFRNCLAAIEASLGVSPDQAQHLVDVYGVVPQDSAAEAKTADEREIQTAITDAIGDVISALVEQVERTLHYLEFQRRQQQPAQLWLMGGGASVSNIGPHLAAALHLPVSIWQLPVERELAGTVSGHHLALFGPASALSALAWRAA